MAFTNSPQFNTYKTVDVNCNITMQARDGDPVANYPDGRIVNMYYDPVKDMGQGGLLRAIKRDGMENSNMTLSKVLPTDTIRGFWYNIDSLALYWAVGNKVYSVVEDPQTPPTNREVLTLGTTTGPVGFCSYFRSDGTQYVVITDGIECWLDDWATDTQTEITDVDFPTPHVPTPIYIDGYLLVIKEGTQEIYNSEPDDPFSWSVDNFIQAEVSSDPLVHIIKVRNYMVAMGTDSTEFFWDAGIATGSPFARNDSAVSDVGYITGGTFIGHQYYFIGQDRKHNIGVFKLDGFKCERISNPVIDRLLQKYASSPDDVNRPTLNKDGHCINMGGHNFYIFETDPDLNDVTWVYDTQLNVWYEWLGADDEPVTIEASWMTYNGVQYLALQGSNNIAQIIPEIYQDFGVNFTATYITGTQWFETYNWKVLHRLALKANQVSEAGSILVNISWSDDDGLSWSTPRTINLESASQYISRCGKFRRRAFRIDMTANAKFVLEGLKLDINVYGI